MERRALATRTLLLIAATLAFGAPAPASAAPARGEKCATTTATATAAASRCAPCKPSLKGSAFNDTAPAAGAVGTTAGTPAVLEVRLNRGCRLPRGARMTIIRREIDSA